MHGADFGSRTPANGPNPARNPDCTPAASRRVTTHGATHDHRT